MFLAEVVMSDSNLKEIVLSEETHTRTPGEKLVPPKFVALT